MDPEKRTPDRITERAINVKLTYIDIIRITEALDYLAAELRSKCFPAGDLDELQGRLEEKLMEAEEGAMDE